MTTEGVQRKMAAILCADVEGYTRLMQDDPEATLHTLTGHRDVFRRCAECRNGRIVDSPGDNLLIEFVSAIEAVQCAVEIQRELAQKNAELADDRRMRFRIGIDLGDVLEKDGALYGDGVNISARLQSLSESGGICISGRAYDQVVNRLPLKFEFLGNRPVKNIADPVRVYRVLTKPGEAAHRAVRTSRKWPRITMAIAAVVIIVAGAGLIWRHYFRSPTIEPASIEKTASTTTEQPSIAVLPFANMSPDPDQEYFVDGLSEEILNSLAQIQGLNVTGRTSSFTFKGSNKKVQEIANELGVDNILEGSVRKAGNDLRITAQLLRGIDGFHLWSKTYDRRLDDIFKVQEDIAKAVSGELKVTLGIGKSTRRLGGTDDVEAYGYYLVANGLFGNGTGDYVTDLGKSLELLDSAISLDPEFALAWALKAQYHSILAAILPKTHVAEQLEAALKAAQRSIQIEPDMPEGYLSLLGYHNMKGDWFECGKTVEKVLELTTGKSPDVERFVAVYYQEVGFFEKAQAFHEMALQSDPYNQLSRADYMRVLAFRGRINEAEEEYKLGGTLFKGDWQLGDATISDIRLGYKGALSRDEMVSSIPVFDAIIKHLELQEMTLSELRRIYSSSDNLSPYELANIPIWAAYFGDPEFALDAVRQAIRLNAGSTVNIWYPVMHEVRQLPRFKEFVREIGLVDYWNKFGWPDICHQLDNGDFECD